MNLNIPTTTTKISSNFLERKEVEIFLKREDLIHPIISGNKWRKLKYNFMEAKQQKQSCVLSFGGMYSNHLHALSYVCYKMGIQSIGVIRGEKKKTLNSTLSFCKENNMELYYLDRFNYRYNKYSLDFLMNLEKNYGSFYMIPEGENNIFGVKGCEEILQEIDFSFDYLCCSVGTGCTASGLIRSMKPNHKFIGFCPFKKHHEQISSINHFCGNHKNNNWKLISDYHFGGFGKSDSRLVKFIQEFYDDYNIKLDLVYTGKMLYSIFELIKANFFQKKTKLLVLHTGGIQGVTGFNFNY